MRVHISLPVRDVTASIGFYERLFGQAASKVQPDYANFRIDAPAGNPSMGTTGSKS